MEYLKNIKQLIEKDIVLRKKHRLIEEDSRLVTYFQIGKLLVLAQGGESRAKYGDKIIKTQFRGGFRWQKDTFIL